MDNLPVHHASVVREAIESVGAKLVFLPPYSPDLSPIELCLSSLKQFLRSAKARTSEAVDQALTKIINECICADDALGWFAYCGLFIWLNRDSRELSKKGLQQSTQQGFSALFSIMDKLEEAQVQG